MKKKESRGKNRNPVAKYMNRLHKGGVHGSTDKRKDAPRKTGKTLIKEFENE